ncbi:apolipoprotein N-acyltransferase [Moraxella nasovis]|uniref:apolipoprotein N-acyltransferase n=1 Tax=Moraxella nasovis TaxID=2904121 RepID=UPI001F61C492|nr:apolipoprotein N-acyltransferase [Moraxella nasovis]UNU73946.1 apolipoprotein N-acyltransferase [Moraxella nasovis]
MTQTLRRYTTKPTKTQSILRIPTGAALIIALCAGMIFSLSLAPYYIWGIAILSPLVLYVLLSGDISTKRAFWTGQFYGFGVWMVGAFWLYTSIHLYGGIPSWLAVVMVAIVAIVMGLFHGVMSWAFVRFLGRQPLAFASLWVAQEWLKTWLFTGFPWLFVGYAFTEQVWINQLAPVLGVLGVSFVVVLLSASLVELFRRKVGYLIISFSLIILAVLLHFSGVTWAVPTGQTMSVSLVQGNISQDIKWLTDYRLKTLEIYESLSKDEWGRDLVVWPEAAVPMFQDEIEPFTHALSLQAKQAGSTWLTGIPYHTKDDGGQSQFYNSVLALGDSEGVYQKQNLVPFGEYIPFQGLLNVLPDLAGMQNMAGFSRGLSNQAPLKVKGHDMGVAICYEVAYPETTRQNARHAGFLLTVSNDAWFGMSAGPWQHLQMVQMRSLETARPFVRATNTGVTAFINEKGQIVSTAPQFKRVVLRGDVATFTGQTPFVIFGHYPILGLSLLLILLSFVVKRQSGQSGRTQKYYTGQGVRD